MAPVRYLRQDEKVVFTVNMFCDAGELILDICIPERLTGLGEQAISDMDSIAPEQSVLSLGHVGISTKTTRHLDFLPLFKIASMAGAL